MRSGVWLLLFGLASPVGACSGGYPLPATRCDEWCDATKGMSCASYYQPASCVSECEQGNLDADECRTEFDAVVACFRTTPRAAKQLCAYDGQPNACGVQADALTGCVSDLFVKQYGR